MAQDEQNNDLDATYAGDKWEYTTVKLQGNLMNGLTKYGAAGWELVEVLEVIREPRTERMLEWGVIFKRKKLRVLLAP